MNIKAMIWSAILVVALLIISNFITWKVTTNLLKKEFRASVTKDSTTTKVDTFWLKPDIVKIKTASTKKADFNIINENATGAYSANFDTTVVVDGEFILKPIPYTNIAYQSIIIGVGYVITFATRPWQVI